MSNEEINARFYSLQKEFASRVAQREPTRGDILTRQAQASMSQQAYNFEGANYFNHNASYFSQPHSMMPSYHESGWGTYKNFSYGHPSMQSQESLISYYQKQFQQLSN